MTWIVFRRSDNGRIGLFPTESVGKRADGEVITTFSGSFRDAMEYADKLEQNISLND